MREAILLQNMVSLARKRGGKGKKAGNIRSQMLRMVMPMLSREQGDALAQAIANKNVGKFRNIWDQIKQQLAEKLAAGHKQAHASADMDLEMMKDIEVIASEIQAECVPEEAPKALSEPQTVNTEAVYPKNRNTGFYCVLKSDALYREVLDIIRREAITVSNTVNMSDLRNIMDSAYGARIARAISYGADVHTAVRSELMPQARLASVIATMIQCREAFDQY